MRRRRGAGFRRRQRDDLDHVAFGQAGEHLYVVGIAHTRGDHLLLGIAVGSLHGDYLVIAASLDGARKDHEQMGFESMVMRPFPLMPAAGEGEPGGTVSAASTSYATTPLVDVGRTDQRDLEPERFAWESIEDNHTRLIKFDACVVNFLHVHLETEQVWREQNDGAAVEIRRSAGELSGVGVYGRNHTVEGRDDLGVSKTDLRRLDYQTGGFDGLLGLGDRVLCRALVRFIISRSAASTAA